MKKLISLLLALAMALSLMACGSKTNDDAKTDDQTPAETVELTVFAAASLTESLTATGEKYMAENENVKISFNFDSSGKLYTQIVEGAPCDLFISAAPKQMNQLDGTLKDDAEKNPDGLDMLVAGSRIDLLENKVVLAVAEGSDKGIDSFDKLAELLKSGDVKLAIGNSDVPVGQYTLTRAKGCGDLGAEECADKVERCRHDDRDAGAEHLGGNHRGDGVGAVVGSVGEVEDQRHHDNEHKQHGDLKHT